MNAVRIWSQRTVRVLAFAAAAGILMQKAAGIPAVWIGGHPIEGDGSIRETLRDPSTDLFR